jgi:hypothetical protein
VKPYHWVLFGLNAAFALLGLLIVILSSGQDRLIGVACLLFFGIGGFVFLMPLLTRRDQAAVQLTEVDGERAFLFPLARTKLALAVVVIGAMTAGSVLLIPLGEPIWGIICAVVLFPVALYMTLMLRRRQGLALTPTRVVVLGIGAAELPWEAVREVGMHNLGLAHWLWVRATDKSLVRRRGRSPIGRVNESMLGVELMVSADQMVGSPELARNALHFYLGNPASRERIGTEAELARSV